MKTFNVKLYYEVCGMGTIEVPDDLSVEEAFYYAQQHIEDVHLPIENAEYVAESDDIDDEDIDGCYFEDES